MVKFQDIKGLSDKEAEASRKEFGDNSLPPIAIESFFDKLKENFEDPIIHILLIALVFTGALAFLGYADWLEAVGIAVAVFIASVVSTFSEYKNESSFRALQEQASRVKNNVFRNSSVNKIFATEIVKGDYVLLQAGDKIPADGKLIFGELSVNQAALTGEPDPVRKYVPAPKYVPKDPSDFLDEYLCFRGSVVDDGEGVLLVDTVGINTFYGKLHDAMREGEERESPLKVKLSDLADNISTFGYIGASSIAVSFLFKQFVLDQGYSMERIMSYLSLANWQVALHDVVTAVILAVIVIVVAVPEGLPMMIAIVLSLNMRKLLNSKVLVRKLMGIETAGSIDILFVDKTGTLTKGVFEPQLFIIGDGTGYKTFDLLPQGLRDVLSFALRESTSAVISKDGKPVGGNASDRALLGYLKPELLAAKANAEVQKEILFTSQRKFSATQLKLGKNIPGFESATSITLVKGAPDLLLPNCTQYYSDQGKPEKLSNSNAVVEKINEVSKKGVRVIAIATSSAPLGDQLPKSLTLVGIIGIMDEIRTESKSALDLARRAGIQIVMITGDRKETAVSVAEDLNLLKNKTVLTSTQLASLSDEQLKDQIRSIGVIARALPTDKSRLVKVCQELNLVVGMTGDGVNDSAALMNADVGFAMGSGSEVAKEASDIVILDDNFNSITQAVLYGRTIFKSIRKFIVFQSTVNCASMTIVFLGPFLGFDFPLTLIQLLWVNLVMDTLAALAFGGEPALLRYMDEKPIPRDEHIITKNMWSSIIINGLFIAFLCIAALLYQPLRLFFVRDGIPSEKVFLTAFFCFFIFLTNFNAFNARTPKINIFDHITGNVGFVGVVALIFGVQILFTYLGGNFLRTEGLTPNEWMLVIGASALIIPFDMVRKTVMKSFLPNQN
jgi:calcium-translocating P-type ATPase